MLYQIKKIIFFLFAIVSIPLLFSWILYDLDSAFHIGSQIGIKLLPDTLFRDDAIILPIFLSLLFPTLGSLIYLYFLSQGMQRLAEAFDSFYRHGQCVYLSANFFGNLYSAVSG